MYTPRIAIVGTGIAGMAAAWMLSSRARITVFEAAPRLGGHTHTVRVGAAGAPLAIDTGFIVFNTRNYPNLTQLFAHFGVESQDTDMSFSVSVNDGELEYSGCNLNGLFGQRCNLLRPQFHRMILDILRFNKAAKGLARGAGGSGDLSLDAFLGRLRVGSEMREHYLLPMTAAIWSCSPQAMLRFPAVSMARFLDNHGLLNINDRPQWRTVTGGSQRYVERLCASFMHRLRLDTPVSRVAPGDGAVVLHTASGEVHRFDEVVIATHADQARRLLDPTCAPQAELLSHFSYQANRAVLHTDAALMPVRRGVWSAWNYLASSGPAGSVCVSYWMNALQNLHTGQDYFVTLNPRREPRAGAVVYDQVYQHPIFDPPAIGAQPRLRAIQGHRGLWFCGSYLGHGFHEDALVSAVEVASALGAAPPWTDRDDAPPHMLPRPSLDRAARVVAPALS